MNIPSLLHRMVPPLRSASLRSSYDYVVVGAGSAGCLLANELSADPNNTVLLVEAGGWDWNPLIHIPAGVYSVFKDPSFNWNYESESEPHADGRRVELPRGKVVGGSSAINAMVYVKRKREGPEDPVVVCCVHRVLCAPCVVCCVHCVLCAPPSSSHTHNLQPPAPRISKGCSQATQ